MKPSFHHRLVNGPFEDPCLYVRLLREKRALLFDAGSINALNRRDILKITDMFITHTHIDHFIGFDAVLRVLLQRETPLQVFGPSNIADCIQGKLKGYSWNVIREYPFKLEVFAVHGGSLKHSSFYAERAFLREDRGETPFDGVLLKEESFKVRAVSIRHDIQCLGFSLEEDFHINIDKAALSGMGLSVGPWLGKLKQAMREDMPDETEFIIEGKAYRLKDLRRLATITRGQKVSYITDASPDEENIRKIIELSKDSDTLYCEAYFLDEDIERARQRSHLTGLIAGRIAREAEVRNLVPIHFSPRYINVHVTPEKEALEEFIEKRPGL